MERMDHMDGTNRRVRLTVLLLTAAMLVALLPAQTMASDSEYDPTGATYFTFTDSDIMVVDGEYTDYKIEGTVLSIRGAGTYVVSGTCSDGSISVKKGVTGVTLVLNGLTLTNTGSETTATAPIVCGKSTGVNIVVATGTANTLTDSVYNNDDNYPDNGDAENAVIKCKDGSQVTITGSGTLNIVSNGKNGIKSGTTDSETDASNPRDAFLTIDGPTMNISTTVNDAISAEQELNILSGTFVISAADDGICSDLLLNIGKDGSAGPIIDIKRSVEGIEAATLNFYSGDISIVSSDDCINAANSDLSNYRFSLNIYGGNIRAYTSAGDGFDSNGTLTISGGTIEVWSASTADNQPLDADGLISITGGTVLAAGGSSGMGMRLSASQPYVTFGSGGPMFGGQGFGGPWGGPPAMPFRNQPGRQQPPTPPSGGAFGEGQPAFPPDVPGGEQPTPPAATPGVGQGVQPPGDQGGQPADGPMGGQMGGWGSWQSAILSEGSVVTVQDSSGNILYNGTAVCNAGYVVFSSPSLTADSSYSLTADGSVVATATATAVSSAPSTTPFVRR
jgi:hypothetical protein